VQRTGNIAVRCTAPTPSGLFLQRLRGSAVFNAFDLIRKFGNLIVILQYKNETN
jgi:hypothetical protein